MKELLTVVTRKGQITVPAEVRRALDLRQGDKVAVSLPEPGTAQVSLRPVRSVAEMTFGRVTPRQRPEDLRELRRGYEEDVVAEVMSESRVEHKRMYRRAFERYTALRIDYNDCYHAALLEAPHEAELWSFDSHFDRVAGMRRVEPGR